MKLNDPLTKDDVELRIGTTSQKGFSLLLYKTARTDVKRLDECYPNLWKNSFFYDNKGLLCCEISIYNTEVKEWISRSDVGTESFTEKEKGSYSDAFKRAGFKWNIGTELYNSPFIWINWEMQQRGNKWTPKGFFSSNLKIETFKVENAKVTQLEISYNGKGVIFSNKPQVISRQQLQQLTQMIADTNTDLSKFNQAFNIATLAELPLNEFNRALNMLQAKLNKAKR